MTTNQHDWKAWAKEQAAAWSLEGQLESERKALLEAGRTLPAPEAIRRHCLQCKGFRIERVRHCGDNGCWLHPWRTGEARQRCGTQRRQVCEPRRRDEEEGTPTGRYVAVICASDVLPTRTGGRYVQLVFRIAEGEYEGRTFCRKLFLGHGSIRRRNEAHAEFQTVCNCVGVALPNDTVQLHGIPLILHVEQKQERNGRMCSVIEGYERLERKSDGIAAKK